MRYFAYCRKSTESEERQALSIPAQRDEIVRIRAKFPDIEIVEILEEARTAKAPGRPIFNDMMKRIERGDAEGIIAWHPDRLARNSIDGGLIIYQLDRGVVKDLKFATYTFENTSQGKFMLQIMFGYSKYYVDNLSENVKRGIRRKLEQGIKPGLPPPGYKNDPTTRTIVPDPERFDQVRKMWDLLLIKNCSVSDIWQKADQEWAFRTQQAPHRGGKRLALSSIYKLFSNRFYCGFINHKGNLYAGSHRVMVTPDEFERAQRLIQRQFRRVRQKRDFAFTGMIRCGFCGCAVTAEIQTNRYGRTYTYYRCTKKRRDVQCNQSYISRDRLESQILSFLREHQVEPALLDWAATLEGETRQAELKLAEQRKAQRARQLSNAERSLKTLTDLRVRNLINDHEFVLKRAEILGEADRLRSEKATDGEQSEKWLEFFKAVKTFNEYAPDLFEKGESIVKRNILALAGSNFSLIDKRLTIQAADFYNLFIRGPDFLLGWGQRDYVRTFSDEKIRDEFFQRVGYLQSTMTPEERFKWFGTTSLTSLRPQTPDTGLAEKHWDDGFQMAA